MPRAKSYNFPYSGMDFTFTYFYQPKNNIRFDLKGSVSRRLQKYQYQWMDQRLGTFDLSQNKVVIKI